MFESIRKELLKQKDNKNAILVLKLCKDQKKENVLGIKIPHLRSIAKRIIQENGWEFLEDCHMKKKYLEETIIEGLVIGYIKIPLKEKLCLIKKFVPCITNWMICDTFCPTIKIQNEERDTLWQFIMPYLQSSKEFEVRFGIIMLLDNFISEDYIDQVLVKLDNITCYDYYASMAKAWTLAEIGIKFNQKLMTYLKGNNRLDDWTYNKALQKMIESYRVDKKQKAILRQMKRKK